MRLISTFSFNEASSIKERTLITNQVKKELEQLLRGEKDLPILHGWRFHHGGKQLLEFIDGRSQLAVTDNGFEIKH